MVDWKQLLRSKRIPGGAIWPLRLFLGITFIWASWDKLSDPAFFDPGAPGYIGNQLAAGAGSSPLGGLLTGFILPNAALFGMLTMAGELLIGLAVLLGWYTRFSAIMGLLINLMFFLTITWDVRPYYFGSDIVFIFAWLTLALAGPGPLSMDAYWRRRFQAPAVAAAATAPRVAAPRPAVPGQTPVAAGARPAAPRPTAPIRPGEVAANGTRTTTAVRPAGAVTTATRVSPAVRPANGQVPGRSSRVQERMAAEDLSRRQFNVLALSGLAAAVLAGLEMVAWPVLHGNKSGSGTTVPGAGNPAGPPAASATPAPAAQVPAATATTARAPQGPPAVTPTPAAAAQVPGQVQTPNAPAPPPAAPSATPVPPPPATPTTAAPPPGQLLATPGQLPVGQALEFTDPSDGYPGVLVHLDSGYSAYTAICTHEDCQVGYIDSAHLIGCPCHGSIFDPARNGAVVRGPARRPLHPIAITVGADGSVYLAS